MRPVFATMVQPEWLDYNGHMNVAYYVLAFDMATDAVYETWDVGEAYVARGYSLFTLGMNVDYLAELFKGDPIRIETQLIDADHKRIHYVHEMFHGATGRRVATNECLCMNVNLKTRRSAPFPVPVNAALQQVLAAHRTLGRPANVGRTLGIRRENAHTG